MLAVHGQQSRRAFVNMLPAWGGMQPQAPGNVLGPLVGGILGRTCEPVNFPTIFYPFASFHSFINLHHKLVRRLDQQLPLPSSSANQPLCP